MNAAHVKTTLAALATIATPPHLRAQQGIALSASPAPGPAAGAVPKDAAPRAAEPGFSWDDIVAKQNARNSFHQGSAR